MEEGTSNKAPERPEIAFTRSWRGRVILAIMRVNRLRAKFRLWHQPFRQWIARHIGRPICNITSHKLTPFILGFNNKYTEGALCRRCRQFWKNADLYADLMKRDGKLDELKEWRKNKHKL